MAGVEKVSDQEIVGTAEAMLLEVDGDLRRVSARDVRKRCGGAAERVNRIVGAWKQQKAGEVPEAPHEEGPAPIVPEPVARALDMVTGKVLEFGPLVARLIEAARREERHRFDREIVTERDLAKTAFEGVKKDLEALQQELHGSCEELDHSEHERSELTCRITVLEKDLEAERQEKEILHKRVVDLEQREERALAEARLQRERREASEQTISILETQLTTSSESHRSELRECREAFRLETETLRAEHREFLQRVNAISAEPAEAGTTIHLTPE